MSFQSGPQPATLTLLRDLSLFKARSKVRFLACIESYHAPTSTLTLTHTPLGPSSSEGTTEIAKVDIAVVQGQFDPGSLPNGEWINVIGYIRDAPVGAASVRGNSNETEEEATVVAMEKETVHIQALQIWSAGSIDLRRYEKVLGEKLKTDSKVAKVAKRMEGENERMYTSSGWGGK